MLSRTDSHCFPVSVTSSYSPGSSTHHSSLAPSYCWDSTVSWVIHYLAIVMTTSTGYNLIRNLRSSIVYSLNSEIAPAQRIQHKSAFKGMSPPQKIGSLVPLVPWFPWFLWFLGSLGSSGSSIPVVPWFLWFLGFLGSSGSLAIITLLN